MLFLIINATCCKVMFFSSYKSFEKKVLPINTAGRLDFRSGCFMAMLMHDTLARAPRAAHECHPGCSTFFSLSHRNIRFSDPFSISPDFFVCPSFPPKNQVPHLSFLEFTFSLLTPPKSSTRRQSKLRKKNRPAAFRWKPLLIFSENI